MVVDSLILAAGIGSRLRPITYQKPKCLVKVEGMPILIHQLQAYISAGIKRIHIVVGYKANLVERAVKEFMFNNNAHDVVINFIMNQDYDTTNNMYSLYLAFERLKLHTRGFVLSNGDVVYEPSIIQSIVRSSESDLIAVDVGSYCKESMKVQVSRDGYISAISKEIPESSALGNSVDLYKLSGEASYNLYSTMKRIIETEHRFNEWTEVAFDELMKSGRWTPKVFDIGKRKWVEIDDYRDLSIADKLFSKIGGFNKQHAFFIDLDGTIYLGEKLLPGSCSFIKSLLIKNYTFYFISNNSSKSKEYYAHKLSKLLGMTIVPDRIVLSTDGVISFLKSKRISRVYVVGTQYLINELERNDITITKHNPEIVVIGYDTELTYQKLIESCILINSGVDYIATHPDVACPTEYGPIPDAGALVEMFKVVTGKQPMRVFGKPSPEMVMHIIQSNDINPSNVVFIGDRLYTDMALAKNIGAKFILVLTGETTREMVEHCENWPDLVVTSLEEIIDML